MPEVVSKRDEKNPGFKLSVLTGKKQENKILDHRANARAGPHRDDPGHGALRPEAFVGEADKSGDIMGKENPVVLCGLL